MYRRHRILDLANTCFYLCECTVQLMKLKFMSHSGRIIHWYQNCLVSLYLSAVCRLIPTLWVELRARMSPGRPVMAQMSQVTVFSLSLSVSMRQDHSSLFKPVFLLFYFHLLPSLSAPFLFFHTIRHFVAMWAVRNVSTSSPKSACMLFTFLKRNGSAETASVV
jgi:hypothetical protein